MKDLSRGNNYPIKRIVEQNTTNRRSSKIWRNCIHGIF